MSRNSVSYIAFWTGMEDFNSKHVALDSKVSVTKLIKGRLNVSAVSLKQSNARSVKSVPLMNRDYTPQIIDILFAMRRNFRESKTNIVVSIFTLFYISRRKYWFREYFRFPVFDGFTRFGMS